MVRYESEIGPEEPEGTPGEMTEVREFVLEVLERSYESKTKVLLSVLEPSGPIRNNEVFIRGLEDGLLYVSFSMESNVMGVPLDSVIMAQSLSVR